MEEAIKLAPFAGPLALAAFVGTFLGGLILSLFWKKFGPWKMLEEAKREIDECRRHREQDKIDSDRLVAKVSDMSARYEIMAQALQNSGLTMQLKPRSDGGHD